MPAPAAIAAIGKARIAWTAARKRIEGELDKLHGEMTSAYKDHGFGAEARQIVTRYESYVAGEKLIGRLDDNPFVPLQIEKTLTSTLTALSRVIA